MRRLGFPIMFRRRLIVGPIAAALLVLTRAVNGAIAVTKMYRIGVLYTVNDPDASTWKEFVGELARRGYIEGRTGHRDKALEAIAELQSSPTYTLPLFLARVDAGLGENDEAMRLLERLYDEKSESIVWLKVDPTLAPLRNDPRFAALVKRVGV